MRRLKARSAYMLGGTAAVLVLISRSALAADKVTISSWSSRYIDPLVEAFNAQHSDMQAEAVVLNGDGMKARIAAGDAPDVVMYHVGYYDYSMESQWSDLTPFVHDFSGSPSDWVPGIWDALTFPAGAYTGQIRRIKSTYEIPVLFYDKAKFAEAGLTEPVDAHKNGRWTWDDMLLDAKKLTVDANGDGNPETFGISHNADFGWKSSSYYEIWALQNGGTILDANGNYTADQPAFADAVQWWADLYNVDHVMPGPEPSTSDLPNGVSAMTIYGTHAPGGWGSYQGWDMAPLPNLAAGRPYNYPYEHGGWVVNKASADKPAVAAFIKFLMTDQAVAALTESSGLFPAKLSELNNWVASQRARYPWTRNIPYTMQAVVQGTTMAHKPGPWYVPEWRKIVGHVNDAVAKVQKGEQRASVALSEIAGPINAILDAHRAEIVPSG